MWIRNYFKGILIGNNIKYILLEFICVISDLHLNSHSYIPFSCSCYFLELTVESIILSGSMMNKNRQIDRKNNNKDAMNIPEISE